MTKGYLNVTVTKYRNGQVIVERLADWVPNLLTNGGKDWVHAQLFTNTTAGTRGCGWVAATQTAFSPAITDTTLSGEIADANGLTRADAGSGGTLNHTTASNSTLIENKAAGATISGAGYADVKCSALFTAGPTGGIMVHEANFSTSSGVLNSGDTLKISWTVNAN